MSDIEGGMPAPGEGTAGLPEVSVGRPWEGRTAPLKSGMMVPFTVTVPRRGAWGGMVLGGAVSAFFLNASNVLPSAGLGGLVSWCLGVRGLRVAYALMLPTMPLWQWLPVVWAQ